MENGFLTTKEKQTLPVIYRQALRALRPTLQEGDTRRLRVLLGNGIAAGHYTRNTSGSIC